MSIVWMMDAHVIAVARAQILSTLFIRVFPVPWVKPLSIPVPAHHQVLKLFYRQNDPHKNSLHSNTLAGNPDSRIIRPYREERLT